MDVKELMLTDSYAKILHQKKENKRLHSQLQKIRGSAVSKESFSGPRKIFAINKSDRNTIISMAQTAVGGAASSQQMWHKNPNDVDYRQDESAETKSISGKVNVSLKDSQSIYTINQQI
jgi:hypothetical protein